MDKLNITRLLVLKCFYHEYSSVYDSISPNLCNYVTSGFGIHTYKHPHDRKVHNTDMRIELRYFYLVKAPTNGKAGNIC